MSLQLQWWSKVLKKTWQIRKYQPFFASKTWFPFIMFMKHADGCSEHNTYQMKWVLTWIFGISTFCCNYSSTSLWHRVSIFPENFNTKCIPCLLQHKPMAFFWMYNRSVQFIFQLAPNLLDGAVIRTLRSQTINPFQQIPSVAGSSSNSLFCGYCNDQFNKNNWNLLNMTSFLKILDTTVYKTSNKVAFILVDYQLF